MSTDGVTFEVQNNNNIRYCFDNNLFDELKLIVLVLIESQAKIIYSI